MNDRKPLCSALFGYCCVMLFALLAGKLSAQDLYDAAHTDRYANYLFKAREYALAANEYERLCFLDSTNIDARLRLIQSHRLAGNALLAQAKLQHFYPSNNLLPPEMAGEKVRLLILNRSLNESRQLLSQLNSMDATEKLTLQLTTELFDSRWESAKNLLSAPETVTLLNTGNRSKLGPVLNEYQLITADAQAMKHRSPALAVALSTPVPGLGKIYSGAWKDGLISALFVGMSGWQAYRGFNRQGVESVYGWVFVGLSSGFYLCNLYCSAKAAKRFNQQQIDAIHQRVDANFHRVL